MDTTLNPKQTDPPHVLVARADEEFAHAHEQIARAGEEIARVEEQLSKLEHDAARHPSDHPQTRMNTFRPAVPGNRPLFDRPAVRGFTGLLLAACIGCRCHRLAVVLRRCGHYREVGAAARCDFIAAARKPGSGSDRTGRRCADRRRPVARVDAVAPVDGARSRNPGARNRAAQGRPGTNGPRQCERRRAAQGQPGTNGPRHCQGFRAEPAAQDISASATADCRHDAQAGADAPVAASHSAAASRIIGRVGRVSCVQQ